MQILTFIDKFTFLAFIRKNNYCYKAASNDLRVLIMYVNRINANNYLLLLTPVITQNVMLVA